LITSPFAIDSSHSTFSSFEMYEHFTSNFFFFFFFENEIELKIKIEIEIQNEIKKEKESNQSHN